METKKRGIQGRESVFIAALIFLVLAGFLSPVHAAVSSVSPIEGTIGTTVTISGDGFGVKKGTALIGKKQCKVLSWNDTNISCLISLPIAPGLYDVRVNPQGTGADAILPKAFTIKPPELHIPTHRPHFVSAGDVVTVQGKFFGDGRGWHRAEIGNLRGAKLPCNVLNWTMDSITFKLPRGLRGIVHLRITNAVGSDTQPWWGTFAEPPINPPNMLGSYTGVTTHDNASAVSYNGSLFAFYPHVNDDNNKIAYRIFDGSNWSDGYYLKTIEGVYEKSKAQINPIVVDDVLYVFYTGTDGKLYYNRLDFVTDEDEIVPDPSQPLTKVDPVWLPRQQIPGAQVQDVSGRFAAVYNFTKKWIEVYWTPDSVNVYMKTYRLDTKTWTEAIPVTLPRSNTTVAPYFSAVFNQLEEGDYVTYLSWADGAAGYLGELKDGAVLRNIHYSTWQPVNSKRAPSLADLGNDYLAVIYNRKSDRSYYQKYDKNTRTVVSQEFGTWVSDQDTDWAPTGITFSQEAVDENSPTGFRMNTNFYVFVGNNSVAKDTRWQFKNCEFLGYWMPTTKDGEELDFGNMLADTFQLWPIIGIIDMPPFTENGHECQMSEWEKCGTQVEYSFSKATTTGMSVEGSAGMYVRTRARSPVEMSASGGYTGGYEDSTTIKYVQSDILDASREGSIVAYYYAPKFRMWTMDWYNLSDQDTGLSTATVKVTGAEIRKEAFTPHDGPWQWQSYWAAVHPGEPRPPYMDPAVFPYHETELDASHNPVEGADKKRLLTYCKNPTDYKYALTFRSTCEWQPVSGGWFSWEIDKDHSTDNGFYIDMKLGIKGKVAAGMEGSFKLLFKTKTQYGVGARTDIRGPMTLDSDPARIISFHTEGYWLNPSNKGYWIPEYRRTMGDKPWFITYRVTDGAEQGRPGADGKPVPVPFYPSCP